MEPLVSSTLRPMTFTGSGPLWSSTSSTEKSLPHIGCDAMLLNAWASTARIAFQSQGIAPLFEQLMTLDYGKCRLSIAVPDGVPYTDVRLERR